MSHDYDDEPSYESTEDRQKRKIRTAIGTVEGILDGLKVAAVVLDRQTVEIARLYEMDADSRWQALRRKQPPLPDKKRGVAYRQGYLDGLDAAIAAGRPSDPTGAVMVAFVELSEAAK